MVRASIRVLLACLLAISVFLPAAASATEPNRSSWPSQTVLVAQQPTGPDIPTQPTTQDGQQSRQKLVLGVVALLLLGIVILGHRTRTKRRKKAQGG